MIETDILIAGGGIAGLTAAARLSAEGHRVIAVDPAPAGPGQDLRTTAFLQPAIATLTKAGVWDAMQRGAAPLRVMRIVDAGGRERIPRETADFLGTEAGHDLFGWNVDNQAARTALLDCLARSPAAEHLPETAVTGLVTRTGEAIARLSDGRQITARLVIGADGRDSTVARLAGIALKRWGYGQSALVFVVSHPGPHEGVSTEIHRTGGPLTLVPMPDRDGAPASSVVWMMPNALAAERHALSDADLGTVLTAETMGLFGPLRVIGARAMWPIISQAATRLAAQRTVLVAEAAHVMPPIGAQGLNTSLDDIEQLARLIAGAPDPGDDALLARYAVRQMPKVLAKIAGVDALNRAAMTELQPLRDLRRLGLSAIHRITPLRRLAIRAGLGT